MAENKNDKAALDESTTTETGLPDDREPVQQNGTSGSQGGTSGEEAKATSGPVTDGSKPEKKTFFWLGLSNSKPDKPEVSASGTSGPHANSDYDPATGNGPPGSPGGTGISCSEDCPKEKLTRSLKKEVKHIMEESVMLKCVHEDSASITSLCQAIDACLSYGLKRRALGLFKTRYLLCIKIPLQL